MSKMAGVKLVKRQNYIFVCIALTVQCIITSVITTHSMMPLQLHQVKMQPMIVFHMQADEWKLETKHTQV